jgi:hypothetical protein
MMSVRRIRRTVNRGAMLTVPMPRISAARMLPPVSAAVTPTVHSGKPKAITAST